LKPEARVKLTLLGGFQAQLEASAALVLPTKKAQALLAYLAVPPGQAHLREQLATLLWGDMQDAQARGNLRYALSKIRKALPPSAWPGLVLDGPSVALDPAVVDVDVARFEQLVADGRPEALEQIAGLYRGDLLAGLALAERPFEEWLTSERERLHELALQGLGHLLSHQQKAGAAEPAVQTGLRLLVLDPLQEPVHRAVMRLYARLGRREAALRQYQLCVDALKRELSTPPEAETTQLYQELLRSRGRRPDRVEVSGPASGAAGRGPAADLRSTATTAQPESPPPTNLPAPTSELIGRAAALAEVTELLGVHRLVTLIGAGGIGKTRLGLEAARELLPGFPDGVWVAELAPLSDPGLVPVTVAVALGLTLPAGAESPERVAAAVGAKRILLVLDNCEHVIDAAARTAAALLNANPSARVMATSREPLRTPGEYVYRVLSLALPAEAAQDRADLLETAAVKLFVARARAVDRRFSPDACSAVIIGAICRRLDGIPLAIELAAARTATLGLEDLAVRLDDRFRLLTGGLRTALPRHQTLRATFDWSHELLTQSERVVLRRLAVFAGTFTLEAASAVAANVDNSAAEVVHCVANLVGKSLLSADVTGATAHYRLLETTRAYARDKLGESRELEQCARRHAEYYRELFERAEAEWQRRPTAEWLMAYGHQIDNLRAALDWASSPDGDAIVAVALVTAAVPLWVSLSLLDELRARVERALSTLESGFEPDPRRRMQLHAAVGWGLLYTRGRAGQSEAAWATALELAERLDDTAYRLQALWGLWAGCITDARFGPALTLARRFANAADKTNPADRPVGDRMLGSSLHYLGDQSSARRHLMYVRSDLVRVQSDRPGKVRIASWPRASSGSGPSGTPALARVLWLQGLGDEAMRTVASIVDEAVSINHPLSLCNVLAEAACPVSLYAGDVAAADRFTAMLLDQTARHALDVFHAYGRWFKGMLLIKQGEVEAGLQLLDELRRQEKWPQFHTAFLGGLAEGFAAAGDVIQGLTRIDEALARAELTEERWVMAELLRIRGELLLLKNEPGTAQEYFLQALDCARRQDALAWELRAATSVARLWHRQHRTAQARKLLAPVYARFTEGFGTADLIAAKSLLASLR